MWEKMKKIPWWIYLLSAILIFVIVWQVSGNSLSRQLFRTVINEIVSDKTAIIDDLEKQNAADDKEKARLYQEIAKIQQQRAAAQAEANKLKGLINEKDQEIIALRAQRPNITIPSDANSLADEFRTRGYSPAVR